MISAGSFEFVGFNHVSECAAWIDKTFAYYVIQYAERGNLDYFIDQNPVVPLVGPVVWLTFPGPCFKFGRQDGGVWHHRFVSFKGKVPDAYVKSGLFPFRTPVIEIREPHRFTEAFDRLLAQLAESRAPTFRTIHWLEELLIQLGEQPRSRIEEPEPVRQVRRIAADMAVTPLRNWNWNETAREIGVSYPHFRRLFHDTFHTPPTRFLLLKRMAIAAVMLRSSEQKKIKEIADSCGFYDLYHFSKLFRKYYGVAPGQYRRNHMAG